MAERRMFAKSVVESARFLKMPVSSQNLYFHLGMHADDDGIVEAHNVINLVKANEDDLRVLCGKGFVRILNEDLVTYLEDWREMNRIRPDRKKDSVYKKLLLQIDPDVELLEKRERSDLSKRTGPSMDGEMSAQCSTGKGSTGKDSTVECSTDSPETHTIKYQLDHEYLTTAEYESLTDKYPQTVVDSVIGRILGKPYHGCLNVSRIASWCAEQASLVCVPEAEPAHSGHALQLQKLAKERTGEVYGKYREAGICMS